MFDPTFLRLLNEGYAPSAVVMAHPDGRYQAIVVSHANDAHMAHACREIADALWIQGQTRGIRP